jgi:hypothetical protein
MITIRTSRLNTTFPAIVEKKPDFAAKRAAIKPILAAVPVPDPELPPPPPDPACNDLDSFSSITAETVTIAAFDSSKKDNAQYNILLVVVLLFLLYVFMIVFCSLIFLSLLM